MDSFKESLQLSMDFPINIFHTCGHTGITPYLHQHDCLELNLIIGGEGINIIGDTQYKTKPIAVLQNKPQTLYFTEQFN